MDKILRPLFFVFGLLALCIGIAGIFLPLLPTTPFILLAAFFWAKSSRRFHQWLLAHRTFGPMITNWQKNGSIPRRAKYLAATVMSVSFVWLVFFHLQNTTARIAVAAILLPALLWMLTRPDAEKQPPD